MSLITDAELAASGIEEVLRLDRDSEIVIDTEHLKGLIARLRAAEERLDAVLCAGPPSRFEGNDCALCDAAASGDPERHDADCDYRLGCAHLAAVRGEGA